jgi:hypothetical protein
MANEPNLQSRLSNDDINLARQQLGYLEDTNKLIEKQINLGVTINQQLNQTTDGWKNYNNQISDTVDNVRDLKESIKDQLEILKATTGYSSRYADLTKKINDEQNKFLRSQTKSLNIENELSSTAKTVAQDYIEGLTARYRIEDQLNKLAIKQSELREAEKGIGSLGVDNAKAALIANTEQIKILEKKLQTVNDINKGEGTTIQNLSKEDQILLQQLAVQQKQMDISRNFVANHIEEKKILDSQLTSWQKLVSNVIYYTDKLKEAPVIGALWKGVENILSQIGISFDGMLRNILKFDSLITNLSKNLQISKEGARTVGDSFVSISLKSSTINSNVDSTLASITKQIEANNELNASLGTGGLFTAKSRLDQIEIVKGMGLQAEEGAKLYGLGKLNNQNAHQVAVEVGNQVVNLRKATGITLDYKKVLSDVAKVGGQLAAQYQNNPELIAKAVIQTQKLGLTLEQAAKMSDNLLNFESSIENELKAELLTGKALNLERARELALRGDSAAAAEELVKQVGSLEEFQNLNVIQQRALAEAVGMTASEMADSLKQQKLLAGTAFESKAAFEEMAREAGRTGDYTKLNAELSKAQNGEQLTAQASQISNQERFQLLIEKLQESLANIASGPLGNILDKFAKLLSNGTALKTIFAAIGTIMSVKLIKGLFDIGAAVVKVIPKFAALAAEASLVNAFTTGFIGLGIALAAAGVAYAAINAASDGDATISQPGGGGGGGVNVPTGRGGSDREINVYVKSESSINQNGQEIGRSSTQYQKQQNIYYK